MLSMGQVRHKSFWKKYQVFQIRSNNSDIYTRERDSGRAKIAYQE
jgi:hypothetical protein